MDAREKFYRNRKILLLISILLILVNLNVIVPVQDDSEYSEVTFSGIKFLIAVPALIILLWCILAYFGIRYYQYLREIKALEDIVKTYYEEEQSFYRRLGIIESNLKGLFKRRDGFRYLVSGKRPDLDSGKTVPDSEKEVSMMKVILIRMKTAWKLLWLNSAITESLFPMVLSAFAILSVLYRFYK